MRQKMDTPVTDQESEQMDTHVTDQESEHRRDLLEAVEDERRRCKIVASEKQEMEYAMLRSTGLKFRKLEEFLSLNVWDPMSYLNEDLEPQPDKNSLMNAAFGIMNIQVSGVTVTELRDKMQEYTLDCSLLEDVFQFSIRLACESLDSPYIDLIDVKPHDPRQADDAQQFIDECLKKNSIPILLQGLLEYCNKVCQRAELVQQIESQFTDCVSVRESEDDGTLSILVKDAAKVKTYKLELQWGICYDADLVSFSFAFGFKCQSSLRKKLHPDVIKGVLESKSMTQELCKNFKKLISSAING